MKRIAILSMLALAGGLAWAKLPALSDEAKAKAAEAAAKTAHGNKVADFLLCKSMDRVAATYLAEAKKAGKEVKPTTTPPCTDPGAFAASAVAQTQTKPIEAAGAHSPPRTANSPPSTKAPASSTSPTPAKSPAGKG
jgi:hypothetical protein